MERQRDPHAMAAILHRGAGPMPHRCKTRGGAKNNSRAFLEAAVEEREALSEPDGPTSLTELAYLKELEAREEAMWKHDLDHEAAVERGERYYDMERNPCQCHSCSFVEIGSHYDDGDG